MTIDINVLENGEGIELQVIGVVHGRDIIAAIKDVFDNYNLKKRKYHIIDKSKCTEYYVSADDVLSIVELDKKSFKTNPELIVAFIESETLTFSLTGLWQDHVEDVIYKTKSFADRPSALEWIEENKL